jgi:hypothetical protein
MADVVAAELGIASSTYVRARSVVLAAEADPARFGDLVRLMDNERQVLGAYRSLRERVRGDIPPSELERHQAILERLLDQLDLTVGTLHTVDPRYAATPDLANRLAKAMVEIRQFQKFLNDQLKEGT